MEESQVQGSGSQEVQCCGGGGLGEAVHVVAEGRGEAALPIYLSPRPLPDFPPLDGFLSRAWGRKQIHFRALVIF